MDLHTLKVLSLDDDPGRFSQEIGESFRSFGFAMVRDHGIEPVLIKRGWELTRALFDLPENVKRGYHVPGLAGARGYTPFGKEIAKGAVAHDLKEFWHVGRNLPPGHQFASAMPPNVWPAEIEEFQQTFTALFSEFDRVGAVLLSRIAAGLDLPPDWFDSAIAEGNSVLRLLHYPPLGNSAQDGGIRAGAHEDINLITLLLGAEEAGLELMTHDGRWLSVSPPEGAVVVNIGDMLQRLTNHVLPSTTHRVRNPDGDRARLSRYSMPFFLHFRSDFRITTLPQCLTPANPDRYPQTITADAFLQQRLEEIGLKK